MNRYSVRIGALAVAATVSLAACSSSSKGAGVPAVPAGSGSGSAAGASSGSPTSASPSARSGDNSTYAPGDVAAAVAAALKAATSVHVSGKITDSGDTVQLDVHYAASGGSGYVVESGQRIDLIGTATELYFKAAPAFWQQQLGNDPNANAILALMANKWVKVPPTNSDYADVASLVDKDKFADELLGSPDGPLAKTDGKTIGGIETVGLKDTSEGSVLYIAKSGPPLPIELVGSSGADGGDVTFTDYNQPFTVQAPPPAQVFDLAPYLK